jgi:carboxymethylenebutenolidase
MRVFGFICILFVAQFAAAQDWAAEKVNKSPRHHEWVTVKHDGRSVDAFVAYPESKDKAPVVVVIQTINGMIDWLQDVSDQLAEAGYIAIAPDLLSGMGPHGGRTTDFENSSKVNEAVGKLPPDQITADLNAAADYALKFPSSNGKLIVAGFCWGGNESFRFATNRSDLKAAFVFYGTPPKEGVERIKAPVYAFYGGADNRVTSTFPTATESMKSGGKTFEGEVYDGAGHGFMQSGEDPNGNAANKRAREDAWERWHKLLAKYQ